MSNDFDTFGEDTNPYPHLKIGSFGTFSTADSLPVEFFMTTFSVHQLSELTFAKNIRPESLDFDLLMQREIDEERVKREIQPYVTSGKDKTIFFPPILVSILPIKGKKIQSYYENQEFKIDNNQLIREFKQLFKISHPLASGHTAHKLALKNGSGTTIHSIKREPCKIELHYASGNQLGTKLVVIDGQHRLKALKDIYKSTPDFIENLTVPVCLLFTPESTSELATDNSDSTNPPTVTEVFRELFVDVNNNAVQVGGHFNILLSESEIGKMMCRDFCSQVLSKLGTNHLAMVEWNQKSKKLSTEITSKYSTTSIGVIHMAIDKYISNENIYSFLLEFQTDIEILNPESEDDSEVLTPPAEWTKFSLKQKRVIENKIKSHMSPLLMKIFFEIDAYVKCREIFAEELQILKDKALVEHGSKYQQVIDSVIEYIPITDDKENRDARHALANFEQRISEKRKEQVPQICLRNVFQRALVFAWAEIIKLVKKHQIDKTISADLLVLAVNESLSNNGALFIVDNSYIQNFIFNQTNISATEDTVDGLACLILSCMVKESLQTNVINFLPSDMPKAKVDNFITELNSLTYSKLNRYIKLFSKKQRKYIEKTYPLLSSPFTAEEREALSEAHSLKKLHQKEVREKVRTKSEVSTKFDNLINNYAEQAISVAQKDLIHQFQLDIDVFGLENGDED